MQRTRSANDDMNNGLRVFNGLRALLFRRLTHVDPVHFKEIVILQHPYKQVQSPCSGLDRIRADRPALAEGLPARTVAMVRYPGAPSFFSKLSENLRKSSG